MLRSAQSFALCDVGAGAGGELDQRRRLSKGVGWNRGTHLYLHTPQPGWVGQSRAEEGCKSGLPGWPIRSQVREFGSLPQPACEHVCGVLGPLSRKVTLGGHSLVSFPCQVCMNLLSPPHLATRVSLSSPTKFPPAPAALRSRAAFGGARHTGALGLRRSSRRAACLGSDPAEPLPARGSPPPVPRQHWRPLARRSSPDCGSVLWGSGN